MPTDRGLVVSRSGDVVTVRLLPHDGCASCALTQFCVGSKESDPTITASAPAEVVQGDSVEVTLDESLVLKATAVLYGIPLTAFLTGVLGGYVFSSVAQLSGNLSIALPVVAGFGMLIPGMIITRRVAFRLNPTATVVRKLDQEVTGHQ